MDKELKREVEATRKAGHALGDDFARRGDPLEGALIQQEVEKDFQQRTAPQLDTVRAMRMAREEILTLRRRIEVLSAQVHVMSVFEMALKARTPEGGMGMSGDVAWLLQREISKLDPPVKK